MGEVRLPPRAVLPGSKVTPETYEPDELVARLLLEGDSEYAIADFPRRRADGTVIEKVHVRSLSDEEQTLAIADAVREYKALLESGDSKSLAYSKGQVEIEHNLIVRHVLAIACRRVDDPKTPFFKWGIVDVRRFTARELGELWLAYAAVQQAAMPSLGEMSVAELNAWADRVAEGGESFPFYLASLETAQAFFASVVRYSAEARATERDLRATIARLEAELAAARKGGPKAARKATRKAAASGTETASSGTA